MSLSRAGIIASQSLASVSTQIDTVSRNIAGVNTPGYSVKTALIYTGDDGGSHSKAIARAANLALFKNSLQAASGQAALSPLSDGLSQLDSFFNLSSGSASDSVDNHSPAALIASLASALQQYGADPSNATSAQTALASAQALVQGLNSATNETQQIREDADASISVSVSNINSILSEFEKVNKDIVVGSQTGDDITDKLDQRDNLLTQLSKEVGIKTVTRPNNDVMIYTDSGVTLFETSPRKVTFKPTNAFDAATVGNAVYADGVQITGSDANMSVHGGRLAGLTQLRDITAPAFQKQLDETARGLITAFSETSQTNPASPAAPGLFTYLGATVVPPATLISGLAGQVTINPSVDPSQGGDISRLRDGGISNVGNPAYVYNTTGASGFSARILQLTASLSATQSFDAQAGLDDSQSVAAYATASIGWLAEQRQQVSNALSYQTAVVTQSSTALSNATGVNLDDQMSRMLALENSYQASARLLSTVNAMFTALFDSMHP